jgi:hypothetical protein
MRFVTSTLALVPERPFRTALFMNLEPLLATIGSAPSSAG